MSSALLTHLWERVADYVPEDERVAVLMSWWHSVESAEGLERDSDPLPELVRQHREMVVRAAFPSWAEEGTARMWCGRQWVFRGGIWRRVQGDVTE